jgi:hypothetical protein
MNASIVTAITASLLAVNQDEIDAAQQLLQSRAVDRSFGYELR